MPKIVEENRLTPADQDRVLDEQLTVTITQYADMTGTSASVVRSRIARGAFRYPIINPLGKLGLIRTADLRVLLGGKRITAETFVRRLEAQDPEALEIAQALASGRQRYRVASDGAVIDTKSMATGPSTAEEFIAKNPNVSLVNAARLLGMSYVAFDRQIREGRFPIEVYGEAAKGRGNGRYIVSADLLELIQNAPAADKAVA